MIKTFLAAAGAVALLTSPAIAAKPQPQPGSTGPFSGTVKQNQTATHRYDNNPLNQACIQVMSTYTVTLTYAPTTDVLTLTAGGTSVTGSNGTATLSLERSYCTAFDIKVTGTSVASTAQYTVTVARGTGTVVTL